jgi:hypothetical protein
VRVEREGGAAGRVGGAADPINVKVRSRFLSETSAG